MEQLFIPQTPPDNPTSKEMNAYLGRMFRDIAQNIETIADGRIIEKRHVEPSKPRDGMIVYADGTNWDPGSGEGFYKRINGAWKFDQDLSGAVLEALFNANTILKADTDDTPSALTIPEQRLVGRITAGVITALTAAEGRTLLNVADGAEVNPDVVSQAEAEAGTATTERIWTAQRVKQAIDALVEGWANTGAIDLASGSPTLVTLDSGLSDVDQIIIQIEGFSTNTANQSPMIQIGPSGGLETTGYSGRAMSITSSGSNGDDNSNGWQASNNSNIDAATVTTFTAFLKHLGSNVWNCLILGAVAGSSRMITTSGIKSLAGPLTQYAITTSGGSATFDAGTGYGSSI